MRNQSKAIGAIDIGGTKIAVGVVGDHGKLLAKEETPTAAQEGFDAAMARVSSMLKRIRAAADVELCGIGIGCTGPVDPFSGEIGEVDFLPGWKGCNPVAHLAGEFDLKVAMENDADAAALGEVEWGAGRGKQNVICVTVGTGIGGGIFLHGALYRGVAGSHPEIGHHVIDDSGPLCFCGAKGCWEILASGPAMAARCEALSAQIICERARSGDAVALAEVAREGRYLGIGIANLITLYAPELIVLSGSVMQSADLFMPSIRDVIRQNCGLVPSDKVELTPSSLGNDPSLIGAAVVWRHRFTKEKQRC